MRFLDALPSLFLALSPASLGCQTRSMAQDSSLDNLHHPPGIQTAAIGTLGHVRKLGEGRRIVLLIPGLGFGDDIWTDFMERHRADYTMYGITLPGFGGTPPLPTPPDGALFAETPWTRSAIQGIEALLKQEHIEKVTILAHWALATQIALRLALEHPDQVEAVILIGGVLRNYYEGFPGFVALSPEQRALKIDAFGRRWFRTVTRQTWDDNNFMSYDYAVNPRRGLFLWREAQAPVLSVWIRYVLEFYSIDLTSSLRDLRVPTLVAQPGFDDPGFYVEPGRNYMRNFCIDTWTGAAAASDRLEFVTIPRSRLFIMYDQPEELDRAVDRFLKRHGG